MVIERISRVPLRTVWQHEALHFTTWLEQNIDLLNEHLASPLDRENVRREASSGDFNVDLLAEDETGRTVVIENQLERSNHEHLGKVLTYLVAHEAEVAVWIVADARPEHVKVITWLNDSSPIDAYLLKLEAVQIGSSAPAPLLTTLVEPSFEARQAATTKAEKTERHRARRAFWMALLETARERTPLHAGISPGDGPYTSVTSGVPGLNFVYGIRTHEARVILWIDRGDADVNGEIFEKLLARREGIEAAFGGPIVWERTEGTRSCKLSVTLSPGGWQDPDDWPLIIDRMVDTMMRFEAALQRPLSDL